MEDAIDQMKYWLPRLHSVIIGPGLGRDEKILRNVKVSIDSWRYFVGDTNLIANRVKFVSSRKYCNCMNSIEPPVAYYVFYV